MNLDKYTQDEEYRFRIAIRDYSNAQGLMMSVSYSEVIEE